METRQAMQNVNKYVSPSLYMTSFGIRYVRVQWNLINPDAIRTVEIV